MITNLIFLEESIRRDIENYNRNREEKPSAISNAGETTPKNTSTCNTCYYYDKTFKACTHFYYKEGRYYKPNKDNKENKCDRYISIYTVREMVDQYFINEYNKKLIDIKYGKK